MKVWCVFFIIDDQPILNSIHATEESAERWARHDDEIEAWHVHGIDGTSDG
jgi:hypothetical protein